MLLPSVLVPKALSKRWRFVSPDSARQRGDRELFIWRDPPGWLAVDSRLARCLRALDGTTSAGALAAQFGLDPPERTRLRAVLADLERRGRLRDPERPAAPGIDVPEPKLPLIETVTIRAADRLPLEGSEIAAREAISVLESAPSLLARRATIVLAGAEPLLRPNFVIEIATWGLRHLSEVVVTTGGELVTDDFARRAARIRLQVEVSLAGPAAEPHDAARGPGSFDRALAGVRRLVSRDVHTLLSCAVPGGSPADLEALYDLAAQTGAHEVRVVPPKALGPNRRQAGSRAGLPELSREMRELFERRPELLRYSGRDAFSALASACLRPARRRSCGSGSRRLLIDCDGALYPCSEARLPEFRIANIRDPGFDFEHVWTASLLLGEYRSKTSVERENGGCADCDLRHFCLGGCRAETYAATGRLEARSPRCAELRAAIFELLWSLSERPIALPQGTAYC